MDPNGIVDPHARDRAIPPMKGCFPPHKKRKGCCDKPDLPDLGSIIVHAVKKLAGK